MFSTALKLTDLNDFIAPSQECIKPVQSVRSQGKKVTVEVNDDGDYIETSEDGSQETLSKAKITLNDCLACSGCITSAESVLITQQSHEELSRVLAKNKESREKVVVLSVSPQSRASLAAKYGLSVEDTARKLTGFFHRLGISYVFDTTVARDFALLECAEEFVQRYRNKDNSNLPMFTSSCPGWICYAEKTHGEAVLPHISHVKSPQQIMGTLVKRHFAGKIGKQPSQIYHATLMPCFDKKLEASRSDFYDSIHQSKDVDCVITTIEVEAMLQIEGISLAEVDSEDLDVLDESCTCELYSHTGSTSGGYSDHVFIHAARELFGETITTVQYNTLRNPDMRETMLQKNGEVVLQFAVANGFHNIQNVVKKLKRKVLPYHFIEIMACPSGCANGGAQIRAEDEPHRALLSRVEALYHSVPDHDPSVQPEVLEGIGEWLHTSYHAVEKNQNALTVRW